MKAENKIINILIKLVIELTEKYKIKIWFILKR